MQLRARYGRCRLWLLVGTLALPNGSCSGRIVADVVVSLQKARKRLRTGKLKEPPIVRQLALADEFRALLDSGEVNQAGLAHLYGLTRARVTQILNLLRLHPAILAYIRQARRSAKRLSERTLRPLVALPPEEQLRQARQVLCGFASTFVRAGRLLDADPRCLRRHT